MESSGFDHGASLSPLPRVRKELQYPVLILIKAVPVIIPTKHVDDIVKIDSR